MNFKKIREARKSLGMTQYDLADALGINRATISKYESGQIEPSISQLKKIAAILKVSWYELYSESEQEQIIAIKADHQAKFAYNKFKGRFKIQESESDVPRDVTYLEFFNIIKKFEEEDNAILSVYHRLNKNGKAIAVERVGELGKIPEYQDSRYQATPAPQTPTEPQEGKDTTPPPEGTEGPQEGG